MKHASCIALLGRCRLSRRLPVSAQNAAPAMNFDSAPNPLTLPDDIYLGEVGGVATNSRGDIFVYTRTGHPTVSLGTARPFAHGGSRLFQFDRNGQIHARDRPGTSTGSCLPRRSASIRRTTSGSSTRCRRW